MLLNPVILFGLLSYIASTQAVPSYGYGNSKCTAKKVVASSAAIKSLNVATVAAPPPAVITATPASNPYIQGILDVHNLARAATGAYPVLPDFTWDDKLAASSLAWSQQLAINGGGLVHSQSRDYGENLAADSNSSADQGKLASEMWYSEKAGYVKLGSPAISNDQSFEGYGHYTQMIWRGSVKVGCGSATAAGGMTVTTCRYFPAGNMIGGKPF